MTDMPALVGRTEQLDVLDTALNRAARGLFQLVNVMGEPGIGKTRLLAEFLDRARGRGLTALAGAAAEFEHDAPLAVLANALEDHVRERAGELRARLTDAEASLLGAVFPALDAGPAPSDAVARHRSYQAVRSLLELIAEPAGLVLVLDDVHWADESSVEALDYLARHPPRGRVLLAVAYRPAQAPAGLTVALGRAAPNHRVEVGVKPLTTEQVRAFLGPEANGSRHRWLAEASGGNPFYLEALAQFGKPPAPVRGELSDSVLVDIPDAVRSALCAELIRLSPAALVVARAAAVVGEEFEPAVVAAAAQTGDAETLSALDDLVARDIVRSSVSRFRFRHSLVRHAVYASAPAGWRLAAHGRVAEWLRGLDAAAPVVAHHVARSARFGDRVAVGLLAEAAGAVSARAPATASYWLRAALRLLPDRPADAATRSDLLIELMLAQGMSGDLAAGRDTARAVLLELPATEVARRGRVTRLLAMLERLVGRPDEARILLLGELRRMSDPASRDAVPLHLRLAVEELWRGDHGAAREALAQVPDEHLAADPGVELAVTALRPMPEYVAGNVTGALRHVDRASRLMATATAEDLGCWVDAVSWLCWSELMLGRYGEAVTMFERVLRVAQDTGQSFTIAPLLCGQARALGQLGELARGIECAEEAVDLSLLLRCDRWTTVALSFQSLLVGLTGDHRGALRLAERAEESMGDCHQWWASLARCAMGVALFQSGEIDEAQEAIQVACGDLESFAPDHLLLLTCCEVMACAEVGRGRPDAAARWADRAERAARPELPCDLALARLARAHAVSGSHPSDAVEAASWAARTFAEAGLRLDAGRAWLRVGRVQAATGERAAARAALRTSAELFEACGAAGLHQQVRREQRKLGIRMPGPRRGRGDEPFGLSPREWEIAQLMVDGDTNQRIANRLVLSIRTVETHVSHIFTKLGVSSRAGVSRVLAPVLFGQDRPLR